MADDPFDPEPDLPDPFAPDPAPVDSEVDADPAEVEPEPADPNTVEGNALPGTEDLGDAPEPVADDESPQDGTIPDPVTPSSTPEETGARVGWENRVNADAEDFAAAAKQAFIDAALAGQTVEITTVDAPDTQE